MYYDSEFEIIEKLAVIGRKDAKHPKELNIVQWGDMKPKFDLRKWKDGEPLKGLTLDEEEAYDLMIELNTFFRGGRKLPPGKYNE